MPTVDANEEAGIEVAKIEDAVEGTHDCENCGKVGTRNTKDNHMLCNICNKLEVNTIFAVREEEAWRKKNKKKDTPKRCSKYLGSNQRTLDSCTEKIYQNIPILKNGTDTSLSVSYIFSLLFYINNIFN